MRSVGFFFLIVVLLGSSLSALQGPCRSNWPHKTCEENGCDFFSGSCFVRAKPQRVTDPVPAFIAPSTSAPIPAPPVIPTVVVQMKNQDDDVSHVWKNIVIGILASLLLLLTYFVNQCKNSEPCCSRIIQQGRETVEFLFTGCFRVCRGETFNPNSAPSISYAPPQVAAHVAVENLIDLDCRRGSNDSNCSFYSAISMPN